MKRILVLIPVTLKLYALTFAIFIFTYCNLKKEKKEVTTFPFSTFFNECSSSNSYILKTVTDSINNLKIDLPEHWDIQVTNDPEVRGIFAMDTSLYLQEELIHSILINSIEAQVSLDNYFKAELTGMMNDSIPIIEVGSLPIGQYDARWVINSRVNPQGDSKELLLYTKGPFNNKIFTINISVTNTENYKPSLCAFKKVLQSVIFLPKNITV